MKISTTLLLCLAGLAVAHPGHEEPENELIYKRNFNALTRRGLAKCAEHLEKRGITSRAEERRAAKFAEYRKELEVRDTDTVLNTSHHSHEHFTPATPDDIVFKRNSTCILTPEGETGPYWVKGEQVRCDLREHQPGVPIVIEGQFIDVETCEPLESIWWDIWNCNSTGVYSGVVETGNGNADDESNVNATFLRGIQKADHDGVVTFETVFPGHYSGRTTHVHMIAHLNGTILPNNTLTGGSYAHVGQLFWDQDLIYKVESTYPYNTNNITITTNADDRVFGIETEDTDSDPVLDYAYLGPRLEDGLFAWVTIVVNTSATYDPNYSFVYTDDGGVAESGGDSGSGGGNGGGSMNGTGGGNMTGTAPSGAMPSASST